MRRAQKTRRLQQKQKYEATMMTTSAASDRTTGKPAVPAATAAEAALAAPSTSTSTSLSRPQAYARRRRCSEKERGG